MTCTGYRPVLEARYRLGERHRLEDDLKAVAARTVRLSSAEQLARLERIFVVTVEADAGAEWATFIADQWMVMAATLRTLAVSVDTTCLPEGGAASVRRAFTLPCLTG